MGLARVKTFVLENSSAWLVVALLRRFVTKSDYQSKRESVTFFQHANVAYGAHKQRRSVRLLRVAFGLLGDELPMSYVRLIIGATNQTQRDLSRRGALSREILDATKALAIDITDATGWYQLSRGLFSVGYFRAAWVARENSIVLSIREGEAAGAGANAVGRAIQAHLERRNFAEVEALLAKSVGQITDSGLRDIRDYLDIMQNKYVMPPLDSNSPSFDAEKLFSELITGKSVALVGRGSPSGQYGNEIDSADTVFRLKYMGKQYLGLQKFHGHRCDVSQFNSLEALIELSKIGQPQELIEDLKIVLCVTPVPQVSLQGKPILQTISVETLYRTTCVSGMRSLSQAMRFAPKSLKVFGFDFYSKVEFYSFETLKFLQSGSPVFADPYMHQFKGHISRDEIPWSFSGHDPVSNFCFAQNLYQAGMFEIEPFGASILALTSYQYVERLEEMLGDW